MLSKWLLDTAAPYLVLCKVYKTQGAIVLFPVKHFKSACFIGCVNKMKENNNHSVALIF